MTAEVVPPYGPGAAAAPGFDPIEQLLWTILRNFEAQALEHYRQYQPAWASERKVRFVHELRLAAGPDALLEDSVLGAPMAELLTGAAFASTPEAVLIVQGMVLERVRAVIYGVLSRAPGATAWTRSIAAEGAAISNEIAAEAPGALGAAVGRGNAVFLQFATDSDLVLHKLDAVGEGVDRVFGDRFGLAFSEVVGDFVADLVPACTSLGMDRRRLMSHLAGALMGI
jgi:hypothetical protein